MVTLGLEFFFLHSKDGKNWKPIEMTIAFVHVPAGFNPRLLRLVTAGLPKAVEKFFSGLEPSDENRLMFVSYDDTVTTFDWLSRQGEFQLRMEEHLNGDPLASRVYEYLNCSAKVALFSAGPEDVNLRIADFTFKEERFLEKVDSVCSKEELEKRYAFAG